VLAIVAISTPLALAIETGVRMLVFPPELDEVRAWLQPTITPWVWWMVPLVALATVVGFYVQSRLIARSLRRLPPERRDEAAFASARFDALMLSTSAPQLPALLATMGLTMGAELLPVAVTMASGTLGVIVQGVWGMRRRPGVA
jgi:hypothetical protein